MNIKAIFKPLVLSLALASAAAIPAANAANPDKLIPVQGIVTGPQETVAFKGMARVNSRLAKDPDFNLPQLVFILDMTAVPGVGSASHAQYVITGPEIIQRRLAPSHRVEITFPFQRVNGDVLSSQTGVASFTLDINQDTGDITQASGSVSSPSNN
jgi:hypothetical protein